VGGIGSSFHASAFARSTDRVLEHSIIYALIELNDPGINRHRPDGLASRRAALIALDQMDNGGLKPEQVTPLLASSNTILKQTAQWIVSHHPEWGEALAGFFRERCRRRT
jgi:hypothetical protein